MRQGTNSKRLRNRNGRRQHHTSSKHHTFDSSGPDVKVRGTASQVYLALARDATTSGNRVAAENFYQHAEHYYRILNFDGNSSGADGGGRPRANSGGGNSDAGRDTAVAANGGSRDSDGLAVADDSKEQPAASDGASAKAGNGDPDKTPSA